MMIFLFAVEAWIKYATMAGTGPGLDVPLSKVEETLRNYAEQGVTAVDVDLQIGDLYESFLDPSDRIEFLRQIVKIAHKYNLKVYTYLAAFEIITHNAVDENGNYITDHTLFKEHPEWVQRDYDGKPAVFDHTAAFWIEVGDEDVWVSPLAKPWRKKYMANIRKVAATGVDAIYIDVPYWMTHFEGWEESWASFDKWTRAEFKKRYGKDPKKAFNVHNPDTLFEDPDFINWLEFRYDVIVEFFKEMRENINKVNPNVKLFIEEYPGPTVDVLYVGADPYRLSKVSDSITHEWNFGDTYAVHRNPYNWMGFVAGLKILRGLDRGNPSWILTYVDEEKQNTPLQKQALLNLAWSVVSFGCNFWEVGGQEMVDLSTDEELRSKIFHWVQANKHLLYDSVSPDGTVGVYFSPNSRDYCEWGWYEEYNADFWGTVMLLLASHVPFRIVLPEELPKLSPKEIPLLILPDVVSITEDEAREFAAYMLRGGKLFATGYPGIYNDRGQWYGDVGEPFPMAGILGLYYPENTMPGEGAPQPAYKRRKSLLYTLERFGKKYFFGVGIDPNEGTAAQEPYPSGMAQNIEKRFAKELFAMYTPPVKVEAPSSLLADFGKMGNSYVIRLANFSGTKRFSQTVEPVKNVKIVVTSPEKIKEAYFIPYLSGEKMVLKPVTKNGKTTIILDELERGGIVVCTW